MIARTTPSPSRVAMIYVKEYWVAIIATALMYGGIHQIISVLIYPITSGIMYLINAISQRSFRDITPPLPEYGAVPWLFHARVVAIGIIVIVAGIIVGWFANLRSERQPNPRASA